MAPPSLDEETAASVLRQVEFYFSDSNLPRDQFLSKTITESEDGLVSLALICSFTRMKKHLKLGNVKPEDVSEDTLNAVAEVLRKSTCLKVSDDGKKVGRTTELSKPEEVIEQLDIRTIAASPLEYDVKLENVESFFGQYAKVNSVRLPRHVADKKLFCGTALVEFATEEDAETILKQSLVFAGVELELKPKKEFDAERSKQAEEFGNYHPHIGSNRKNNSNAEPSYPKGLIVAFTLKNTTSGVSTSRNVSHETANDSGNVSKTNGELESSEKPAEESEEKALEIVNNNEERVDGLESKGMEPEEGENSSEEPIKEDEEKGAKSTAAAYKNDMNVVLREDLKDVLKKFGTVKFIDFKFGEESGYIRFDQPEGAQKARAAAVLAKEGGLSVKNFIATLEPVTGDAEKEYWSLLRGNQRDFKGNRGRGGKFNRGGRGGKHFRSRENDSPRGRANKAQKTGA
ncbi:La domain-containing protein/RRM_3 domain-containing protein/RRM_6 domain-containing protein [Cephalotus follicularis]|uniref:La domain-containing protein/RRM_3 domain-containing protein/RRM_6 domain-containing protein n=1 Tax=Cephalotus follicularis TaxID=3775 RepID=A0A1Q3DF82_CEPFO|nr:La domain-containing protein/RRM_3 domain-containing protein/RRM_6 domain-containing protein [Cephalotus follicularis]